MRLLPGAAGVLLLLQQPAGPSTDPRMMLRGVVAAVVNDSAESVPSRWLRALRRDDRSALLSLGSLARLTYDYPRADSLLTRVTTLHDGDALADYARLELGHSLMLRGKLADAATTYDRVLAGAQARGDSMAVAEALLGMAGPRSRLGAPARVLPTLDRAERLAGADSLMVANARCQRAAIMTRLGDAAARAQAESGIALAHGAGDTRQEGRCTQALAQVYAGTGDMASALDAMGHAAVLYEQSRDHASLASVLQWRGYVFNSLGRYGVAQVALARAVAEGERAQAMSAVGWSLVNLGMISLGMGDRLTARAELTRAAQLLEGQGDQWGAATARSMLGGVARASRDTAEARRAYAGVLAWAEGAGQIETQVNMHGALGSIDEMEGQWDSALAHYDRVNALRAKAQLAHWSGFKYERARVSLRRGDVRLAERDARAAVADLSDQEPAWRYAYRVLLAEVLAAAGKLGAAERELVGATDDLDAWRASLSGHALRVRAMQFDPGVDPDLGVATIIAALADGGRPASAFRLAERRKAHELMLWIQRATALQDSEAGAPAMSAAAGFDPARTLPDSTALLEYVTGQGGEPTTLFVVTRTGLRSRLIAPVDSLAGEVQRFLALLEGDGDARVLGQRLGTALLGDLSAELGAGVTRLVIVPDGMLARLPFGALTMTDGRFVIERFAIGVAPSAATYASLRGRSAGAGPARLLALGDPSFARGRGTDHDAAPSTEVYRSAFDSSGGLARLTGSAREARRVARYSPDAVVRLRGDASEAWLRRTPLDSFRVLHFATHALVDDQTASRTALALAPGGGEDGFLGPGDLAALQLRADLVVLSACRTAGGEVLNGEGVQGLTAPLLQAGARSIVATQWRIGDRSTERVISGFYSGLAEGQSVAGALRTAQLAAIREGAPPSEWAAFVALGDPDTRVPLVPARAELPVRPLLAIVVMSTLLVGLYRRMRNRRGSDTV